jgi:hypothetical protein
MKRYAVFVLRFSLAPIISGTFVVSMSGPASLIEWAHIITGFALIYLIVGILIRSAMHPELRLPGFVALILALLEAIPGVPRLHAFISPILFTTLAWATVVLPPAAHDQNAPGAHQPLRIFALPALVLVAIFYGVNYRYQVSGVAPHLAAAMLVAGAILIFCMYVNQNYPEETALRGMANLTIAAVLFQVAMGVTVLVVRMLEINGGLTLGLARTAHFTGAAVLLAASTMLAIQYRRRHAQHG